MDEYLKIGPLIQVKLAVLLRSDERPRNLLNRKKHPHFFSLIPTRSRPSLPPASPGNPGVVYLSPFCIGQFPLFRGISKPILGLARAATGDSPRHSRRRAFPHTLSAPHPPPFRGPQQSPPSRPALQPTSTTDPSFQQPPEREKPAASRPGSGLGCFHPHR